MNRAALRKRAADAGIVECGAYIEYLEALVIALEAEKADSVDMGTEVTLP